TVLEPPIQVHWPLEGEYFHKSFKKLPTVVFCEVAYPENPPNNHRFPLVSVQVTPPSRAPGTLVAAAIPWIPYTPLASVVLEPLTQVKAAAKVAVTAQAPLIVPVV